MAAAKKVMKTAVKGQMVEHPATSVERRNRTAEQDPPNQNG